MLLTADGPFEENMCKTATNMWRFIEGVSKPLAKKEKSETQREPLPTRKNVSVPSCLYGKKAHRGLFYARSH